MMTDKYCPRGEIKKLEIELWNLNVKGESDEVEKYVGELPDTIEGSVMASNLKTMQDAIEFATELMDQKIRTFTKRQAENKRKLDNNNQAQQQPPKKQNVARAYFDRSSEKKEYAGTLPWSPATTNNQRTLTCYECRNQRHYRSDSPKISVVLLLVMDMHVRYGYSRVGRFDVFFRDQLLVFQQHQDESLYDSWTRFKDIIQKVLNHGLSIWTLIEIFLKHLDSLSRHIINLTAEGDLRKFCDIGSWYAIEDCAQYDKKCSNPTSAISDETIANPNAQIVGDDMVRVQVPRCMAWLDYNEHVDSLSTMDNEVGVISPESTTQTLPSFEEYTPPMTYPEEVEKTLGTPIEVEPLNETKLEEVGLHCNHNTPFSSREVPTFDGPEPQPLLNSPSLDASLRDVIGLEPPIKPHSLDSSRMKEIFDDDWGLESKEVSPLGEELSLFDRPYEVERGRILKAHHLESILQKQISQRMAPSYHDVIFDEKKLGSS
ncbi:hypothetical protein Tco_0680564 [Tanacetum coccineum]|uniref:Reverse transcriptase domain-containing protein n=1 Tax=Tanacetum coccineum TaxID=301880 RepID=A0ABQ4XKV3_9ASTR